MAVTLTRKLIETALAAGPGNRPYVMLWDNSPKGLGLRIRRGGASWVYRYRLKERAAQRSGQDCHVRSLANVGPRRGAGAGARPR